MILLLRLYVAKYDMILAEMSHIQQHKLCTFNAELPPQIPNFI